MVAEDKYRLKALFGMREREKKEAEDAHAKSLADLQKTKDDHATLLKQLDTMVFSREEKQLQYKTQMSNGELTVEGIRANDRHIDALKGQEAAFQVEINRHMEVVKAAEAEVERKMKALIEATQQFKALEKHKEKWQAAVKKERAYQEELVNEDIAQAQYFARMKEEQ